MDFSGFQGNLENTQRCFKTFLFFEEFQDITRCSKWLSMVSEYFEGGFGDVSVELQGVIKRIKTLQGISEHFQGVLEDIQGN